MRRSPKNRNQQNVYDNIKCSMIDQIRKISKWKYQSKWELYKIFWNLLEHPSLTFENISPEDCQRNYRIKMLSKRRKIFFTPSEWPYEALSNGAKILEKKIFIR